MKNFSKVYTALVMSGAMFGAENVLAQGCENQTLTQSGVDAVIVTDSNDKVLNCNINASGDGFHGIKIFGNNNVVIENTTSITTGNEKADAIHADGSQFSVHNSTLISKGNATSDAIFGENLKIVITDSRLITEGNDDTDSVHIENSTVNITNSDLMTLGNNETNALALYGSDAVLNNVNLSSKGDNSLLIATKNSKVTAEKTKAYVDSENSYLFANLDENTISFAHSSIHSNGFGILNVRTVSVDEDDLSNLSERSSVFNFSLNNSSLTTKKALIQLNDRSPADIGQNQDTHFVKNKNKVIFTLNDNAQLTGGDFTSSADLVTQFNLNRSTWHISHPVTVTDMTLNEGNVNLSKTQDFQTLTILGNLSGTGTFALNTDLAHQQADKVVVKGEDSGHFGLVVADSGNEPQAQNGKITLVETQTGTAQFRLKDREYVDAGAFRYRLHKEGNNWVLANHKGEATTAPVKPSDDVVIKDTETQPTDTSTANTSTENLPQNQIDGAGSTHVVEQPTVPLKVLSEKTNERLSLRQAQLIHLEQGLSGIHQRLGELKQGERSNVWVRNLNSRNTSGEMEAGSNSRVSGFKQDYHGLQVGADTALNDTFRLGTFVGTGRSDIDFKGDYGSAKLSSQTVGLYGTFLFDNGLYFDNIVKYERLKSQGQKTVKQRYNGYTLSTEVGRIYQVGQGWTVTPQLQLAWSTLSAKENEDRLSARYARMGARVAKMLELNGWALQPYLEINGVTTKNRHSQVRINQYAFNVASSRGRIETTLGMNVAKDNHRIGLEAKTAQGKYLDQPFAVQANYRYSW